MLGKALARTVDLVVQESGNELLIYDLNINKAVCLNETSALVWQLCDGKNTVSKISDKMSINSKTLVDEDLVWMALDQLNKEGLLEDGEMVVDHFAGLSRREIVRKIGFASMVALPLVSSIIAPNAVAAQSSCVTNICIQAGQEICTGCVGTPISGPGHSTTDGSCGGTIPVTFSSSCLALGSSISFDVTRN